MAVSIRSNSGEFKPKGSPEKPLQQLAVRPSSLILVCSLLVVLGALEARGQVVGRAANFESDDPAGPVIHAKVTSSVLLNTIAVMGVSIPAAYWGIGGQFVGGERGVFGAADVPGVGLRYGVYGLGEGGDSENYGVFGEANSPTAGTSFGVLGTGSCSGSGCTAYGLFASAGCTGSNCATYAVFADGDVAYTGALIPPSDLMFKENLANLESGLAKLLDLQVVTYQHKRDPEFAHLNLPGGQQVGFVAQQVAEVLSDLVVEVVHPSKEVLTAGKEGRAREGQLEVREPLRYKGVKILQLIPILVKAVQEQQAEIEALRAQLLPLQNRLAELEPEAGPEEPQVPAAFRAAHPDVFSALREETRNRPLAGHDWLSSEGFQHPDQ